MIRFGRKVGLPVSVAELFEEPIEELAHRIGQIHITTIFCAT